MVKLKSVTDDIGIRVREYREKLGYTREQFAEKLNISVTFAAEIELGKKGISIDTLIKICELLSVSADYIIWGRGERGGNPVADLTACLDEDEMKHAEDLMRTFVKAISEEKFKKLQ